MKFSRFLIYILSFLLTHLSGNAASPQTEIKIVDGSPILYINENPIPPFAYMSYLGEEKFYREISSADIHLYCFPAYLGDRGINSNSGIGPFRPAIWLGVDQFDYSYIKNDFEEILRADPQAMVIIRLHLDPPTWWEKLNPDACTQLPDGNTFRQCFVSEKWRNQTGNVLKSCIQWLLQSPYADHLIGIHVAAGFTEEWFYHFHGQYFNNNPYRVLKFQEWLRQKYQYDEYKLQSAWNDRAISFNTVQPADISGNDKRIEWRDPVREYSVIETFRFHAETMVDDIIYFCKIVKKTSNNHLLTGAFYGYHYFVTDARRGHGALSKLLKCPDLDYLSSPNEYHRVVGEDWPPMAAIQSVQLHGKLWLAENDTRTSITSLLKDRKPKICPEGEYESGVWLGPEDIQTSAALLWKNAGRMLAYGYGGWWFDMWGGWFSDPSLLNIFKITQDLYSKYPHLPDPLTQSQVCIIVDEELHFWDASFGSLTDKILKNRSAIAKTGAPYHLYLRSDWSLLPDNQYRIIWLMGIQFLTDNERFKLIDWQMSGKTIMLTDRTGTTIFHPTDGKIFHDGKYQWTASELRFIWHEAEVHQFTDSDDIIYSGRGWLSLHTKNGGNRIIRFPQPVKVINPLTDEILIEQADSLFISLKPKSTRLLRINP